MYLIFIYCRIEQNNNKFTEYYKIQVDIIFLVENFLKKINLYFPQNHLSERNESFIQSVYSLGSTSQNLKLCDHITILLFLVKIQYFFSQLYEKWLLISIDSCSLFIWTIQVSHLNFIYITFITSYTEYWIQFVVKKT